MQKVINVLAVASAVVSLAVVGTAGYVYVRKDAIIESVTEKALGSIGGGALGGITGELGGGGLPGLPEKTAPEAAVPDFAPTGPSQPF